MQDDPQVAVITAAMCQGNKLEKVRDDFPDRFFDIGICEIARRRLRRRAWPRPALRPIVDIYRTFLQRSFDQIFQEVALQNLPVVFTLDRAGLTGPDGPTHHGAYDIAYMRLFPNMVVMAPGDELDVAPMLDFALAHDAPGRRSATPRRTWRRSSATPQPIELGQAEVLEWGDRRHASSPTARCSRPASQAAERLREQTGCDVGVINARFAKPLDQDDRCSRRSRSAGWSSRSRKGRWRAASARAVLEAANAAGLDTRHVVAARPARPLHRARRARRAAGRAGPGRQRHLRDACGRRWAARRRPRMRPATAVNSRDADTGGADRAIASASPRTR